MEDSKLVLCSVEAIKCLLRCNDVVYGQMVEQWGGVAKLESLQRSSSQARELFGLVQELLNVHFAKKTDVDMDLSKNTSMAHCIGGEETLISHVCL
ncbi:MAG: hypothetical protein KVP17_003814 [Porospora cf. gigantea B]|nr:MAG: hypothetical protein KVP17_003814 [Porospora cf. gigantea B]